MSLDDKRIFQEIHLTSLEREFIWRRQRTFTFAQHYIYLLKVSSAVVFTKAKKTYNIEDHPKIHSFSKFPFKGFFRKDVRPPSCQAQYCTVFTHHHAPNSPYPRILYSSICFGEGVRKAPSTKLLLSN
jgi:hypothetical protein